MKLDNITLLSVCGHTDYLDGTIKALYQCMKDFEFKSVKLLSNEERNLKDIEVIKIPPLDREKYAFFCIYDLPQYVDTDFCLMVQYDGFIINPQLWDEKFLEFDYIGAPWLYAPNTTIMFHKHNFVGNGGFCIRSQKFLHSAKTLKYNSKIKFQWHIPAGQLVTPEDWFICSHSYRKMLDMNVKFADIKTAFRFSVEHPSTVINYDVNDINTYKSFGFHGNFNTAAMKLLEEQ